jgi:hypothetical protein
MTSQSRKWLRIGSSARKCVVGLEMAGSYSERLKMPVEELDSEHCTNTSLDTKNTESCADSNDDVAVLAGERACSGGLKMCLKAGSHSHHQVDRSHVSEAGHRLREMQCIAVRSMVRVYRIYLHGHVTWRSHPTVPPCPSGDL